MPKALEAFKQQLDINKPEEYRANINALRKAADDMEAEFNRVWTYCPGCMRSRGSGYSKAAEGYEGVTDRNEFSPPRPVLRCGTCHSIWKFLD